MVAFGDWSFGEWLPSEIGRSEIGRSEIGRSENGRSENGRCTTQMYQPWRKYTKDDLPVITKVTRCINTLIEIFLLTLFSYGF
jgi:hypothetical protein